MSSQISFEKYYNIINGHSRKGRSVHYGIDPATEEKLWSVPTASKEDVDDAVDAATAAFKPWSTTPFKERAEILQRFGELLRRYFDELAELLLRETGKPKAVATGETTLACVDAFDHFLALELPDEKVQFADRVYHTRYTPLGVVAAILPWNFPIAQVCLKALPAMLTGNCVIVKPSPYSPYTALKVVEIAQQVLPPGVLQVLSGDDKLGPWLVEHEKISKITFTGSCATGKRVMAAAAKTLKRITLELGGNDSAIICEDVDIKKTAQDLVLGAFSNSGQVCATTKRVYVHEDIYNDMLQAINAVTASIKLGGVREKDTFLGPLQNRAQFDKVVQLTRDSEKYIHSFKSSNSGPGTKLGYYLKPIIVDNPPEDSRIMEEEQFGPVLPIQPWREEEDVISRSNATPMGLGASVWSKDIARATRIAEQLEAGSVFINSAEKLSLKIPFGGHKQSGIGFEGGPSGLLPYCNLQVVHYFESGQGLRS